MISLSICLYSSCEYLLILTSFIRSVILKMSDSDRFFLNISQFLSLSRIILSTYSWPRVTGKAR